MVCGGGGGEQQWTLESAPPSKVVLTLMVHKFAYFEVSGAKVYKHRFNKHVWGSKACTHIVSISIPPMAAHNISLFLFSSSLEGFLTKF